MISRTLISCFGYGITCSVPRSWWAYQHGKQRKETEEPRSRNGSTESHEEELLKVNHQPQQRSAKNDGELHQTGVVESVICAGILRHATGKTVPKEYSNQCMFYKMVNWNDLTPAEWESVLQSATAIYSRYQTRSKRASAQNES